MTTTKTTLLAILATGLLAGTASAADWGFSFGFAGTRVALGTTREWVPAHYETRYEQVLVVPAHYERQFVPARYETRRDQYGRSITVCVQNSGWTEVYVPDQYETRATQVLVPGYYTNVAAPICAPRVALSFGHDNDRRDNGRHDSNWRYDGNRRNDDRRNGRR